MTEYKIGEDRDEVLFAFHRECDNPSAEQIVRWVRRYPQFADDIRAHAAILKDWVAQKDQPVDVPSDTMLAQGRSRTLDALYNAQVALKSGQNGSSKSFEQLMAAQGTDVPQLARELDISRSVLAALVGGRMLAPIGKRLVDALTQVLNVTRQEFDDAFRLATPRIGHAKADNRPTIILRSYEEIIRTSAMSYDRQQYWLGKD